MLVKLLKDIVDYRFKKKNGQQEEKTSFLSMDSKPVQRQYGAIIWFSVESQGDALRITTREMMAMVGDYAKSVININLSSPSYLDELLGALENPVWFACGPFDGGQDITIQTSLGAVNLWEYFGIPFVRLYGDIPAYFPDKHVKSFKNVINVYYDESHAEFYRRWFKEPALSLSVKQPVWNTIPLESVDFKRKLHGKIIFPKNGNSPVALRQYWRTALPSSIEARLLAVGEELSSANRLDTEPRIDEAFVKSFSDSGIDITAQPAILCFLVAQIDDYLRRIKSTMITEALLDLPVLIRGASWEHISFEGRKATYDPSWDVARTLPLIDAAPAIVDMSPNITHAPHERVLRAAGRGTAFLTNRNEALENLMPDKKFCFSFRKESIFKLTEYYIEHPGDAVELGMYQAKVMRDAHSPEQFVHSLTAAVDLMAFRLGGRPIGTQNFVNFPPAKFK